MARDFDITVRVKLRHRPDGWFASPAERAGEKRAIFGQGETPMEALGRLRAQLEEVGLPVDHFDIVALGVGVNPGEEREE